MQGKKQTNKKHTLTVLFIVELNLSTCSGAELALNLKEIHSRELVSIPFEEPKIFKEVLTAVL